MTVYGSARRLGASLAVSAALVAVCSACSSSSNGTGSPATDSIATDTGGQTSPGPAATTPGGLQIGGGTASESVPVGGSTSIGGSQNSSAFCQDFNPGELANMGSATDINKLISIFDKLAKDAPDPIKAQVQDVDNFLHDAANGNVDPSKESKITNEVTKITQYYIAHCA